MKTHVFIATTQGLVAIQNITAINDPDISSVVSVNGTSTTANISGSYHNFVRKGAGIIEQMFGACSYRVDISARIDQGNSWQVAVFLAHLAHSKGQLGDGNVTESDQVICATGEVNTSNQQILAVNQTALKYQLAEPQLIQWNELGAKVFFVVPVSNREELQHPQYCLAVSHLEQASQLLPIATTTPAGQDINTKRLVSANYNKKLIGIGVVSAIFIFVGITQFINQPQNNNDPHKQSIGLTANMQQNAGCTQSSSKKLPMSNGLFSPVALPKLCDLHLETSPSILQVLLIAKDAYTVLPLIKKPQGWHIPLPKHRQSDRRYFLLTLSSPLSEQTIEQLRVYRETMNKPDMLSELVLTQWLTKYQVKATLYSHTLLLN